MTTAEPTPSGGGSIVGGRSSEDGEEERASVRLREVRSAAEARALDLLDVDETSLLLAGRRVQSMMNSSEHGKRPGELRRADDALIASLASRSGGGGR